MNSLNSKYTNTIRNYLIDFLYNVNENQSSLAELFNEANKYEKVTDAEIARALQISPILSATTGDLAKPIEKQLLLKSIWKILSININQDIQ